tara:strand:- start:235 stop:501 length:267 start_codon:yes stop_codon:yes gene_type:complete
MFIYFIYFVIFSILIFVLFIAVKAITRGIEAKENNKLNLNKEESLNKSNFKKKESSNLTDQIKELNKLYDDGILSEEEFKKAKEKILK